MIQSHLWRAFEPDGAPDADGGNIRIMPAVNVIKGHRVEPPDIHAVEERVGLAFSFNIRRGPYFHDKGVLIL